MTENKSKAMIWAEGIVETINSDDRPFVEYKESRPVTDIKHMLTTSVELYGENIAFMQKEGRSESFTEYTYNDTYKAVNALGTALISRGLKDRRISVTGANSYEWAVSYLAAVCGTGVVVPLDKELSEEELKHQIIKADVRCVIFAKKHEKTFKAIKESGETNLELLVNMQAEEDTDGVIAMKSLIEEGQKLIDEGDRSFIDAEIDQEKMSILLFTSGTTGKSKGVMLCHKNIATELMIAPTVFQVTSEDRFFSVLPLHHTYECTCGFLMPLYKGASVAYCRGLKYITKDLKDARPTIMLAVPLLYEKLYNTIWKNVRKQGKENLLKKVIKINRKTKKVGLDLGGIFFKQITEVFGGRMKCLICGGAAINPAILDGFRDFGINAVQGYGLTECAPMGALNPINAPNSASIGVKFPAAEIKAVDINEEGVGEICVRGDHVMMGYFEMPEETAAVVDEEGWLHTGDLGYVDEKGYAFITGRKKNVIITKNGKNVYPEELEYQLSLIPFVEESFVFGQETEDESDITIVASVKIDYENFQEMEGENYTDEDVKAAVWREVDKINEDAPFFRKIKKVIIRKTDFVKNTSSKLIRYAEENKAEQ